MPNSTGSKLYPLFCRPSKASKKSEIIEVSDGSSEDDDDLPLTYLLNSKKKAPPLQQRETNRLNEKQGKRNVASTTNRNPFLPQKKKQKQAKLSRQPDRQSSSNYNALTLQRTDAANERVLRKPQDTEMVPKSESKHSNDERTATAEDTGSPPTATESNATHEKKINQKQQGRIFSDSSMDFVAPRSISEQPCSDQIRNIVHKLNRRMATGGCLSQRPQKRHFSPCNKAKIIQNKRSLVSSSYYLPKKWKIPSWISLEQPVIGNDISGLKTIDHIQWDPMGVLLAVAIDRTIVVYDWDMLQAADLQGRRERIRGDNKSEFKIPPIVKFRLPQPVASLVWNPFNMDELAVGFRVSGETRIYNVDRVARWLSKDPSRFHQRLPPPSTYVPILLQRVTGCVGDILFVDCHNILVSVGRVVFRWQLSVPGENSRRKRNAPASAGILVWRYQPPSSVTSMALIGSNIVLLGTNRGHMCLIDWTKRTKVTLSFSHEHRPKVLQSWVPHDHLRAPNEDGSLRNKMGIVKMRVETSNQECTLGKRHWGRCRVQWVTQCGWLLSMTLESLRIPDKCSIHYSSPEVVFKNADGSLIDTQRKMWSLAYGATGFDLSNQVPACLVGVPAVTKILSHHDKFVLDSQPQALVSSERVLVVHGNDDEVHSIPFPSAVKDLPQALAVHPSLEWIVVGERKRLHIMLKSGITKSRNGKDVLQHG